MGDYALGLALIFKMAAESRAFTMLVRMRARLMFDQSYAFQRAQICYYEAVACFFEAGDWLRAAEALRRDPDAIAEDVNDALRCAHELEAYAHDRAREGVLHFRDGRVHYFDDTGETIAVEPIAYATPAEANPSTSIPRPR